MLEANNLKLLISILKQDRNNHFFCYNYFNHNLTQISKSPNPEISNSQFPATLSPHKIRKGNRMWLVIIANKI